MHVCMYVCMYIYIYIYIWRSCKLWDSCAGDGAGATANLRTNIMDFRGFDSSIILIIRDGILVSIGDFPESLSQAILVRIMLVGRLGVVLTQHCSPIKVSITTIPPTLGRQQDKQSHVDQGNAHVAHTCIAKPTTADSSRDWGRWRYSLWRWGVTFHA